MKKILVILLLLLQPVLVHATNKFTNVREQGVPYLSKAVLDELVQAFDERLEVFFTATAGTPFPQPVWGGLDVGVPIARPKASTSGIRDFGQLVYTFRSHIDEYAEQYFVDIPSAGYDANGFGGIYNSKMEFLAAAGLPRGWRSAYVFDAHANDWRDIDDPMYGTATNLSKSLITGEILGPWIIDDIQIVLTSMRGIVRWQGGNPWTHGGVANTINAYEESTNSFADVRAKVDATYASTTPSLADTEGSDLYTPRYQSYAVYDEGDDLYRARKTTSRARMNVPNAFTNSILYDLGGTMHFAVYANYEWATVTNTVWGLDQNKWNVFDSVEYSTNNIPTMSGWLGDNDIPAWYGDGEYMGVRMSWTGIGAVQQINNAVRIILSPDWTYTREDD